MCFARYATTWPPQNASESNISNFVSSENENIADKNHLLLFALRLDTHFYFFLPAYFQFTLVISAHETSLS